VNGTGHHFEDRLWEDLLSVHGAGLETAERPVRHLRLRRLRWAGAGLAATVAAVVSLLLVGSGSPAAFAVTTHADGTVTIRLRSVDGLKGANEALSRLHTGVFIVAAGAKSCPTPTGVKAPVTTRTGVKAPVTTLRPSPKVKSRFLTRGVGSITVPKAARPGEAIRLRVLPRGNKLVLKGYVIGTSVCGRALASPGFVPTSAQPRSSSP
jgi:hypothetical protein